MIVILQDIRSMHNVGSIFRTADAAGIEKLYLCGITPEPIDRFKKFRPRISKVALGAEKSVKWEKCKSALVLIRAIKRAGYKIFAIEQSKKSVSYKKIKIRESGKVAFIFGNEVKGLNKTILRGSDKILEIPMSGKKESLNVAVAFGIIVFHFK